MFFLVIAVEKNPTCRGLSLEVRCLYQLIYKIPTAEFHCEKSENNYSLRDVLTQLFGNHTVQVTLVAFVHFHQLRDELINAHPKIEAKMPVFCLFVCFQHH